MPRRSPEVNENLAALRATSPSHEPQRDHKRHHHARRSRSPRRDEDGPRHKRHRSRSPASKPVKLPYKAKELSKRQYDEYKPLFQSYLDIQKNIQLEDLDEREAKGRWKSFISRWNRGDLARSWYDPSMLTTAQEAAQSHQPSSPKRTKRASPAYKPHELPEEQSDDDFGPAPPTSVARQGPTAPKLDDLAYRNELHADELARNRSNYTDDLRHERKTDRTLQKSLLDELVPRADPGSRERQLEKKREVTGTLQSFRDAKESGDVEVAEGDLMGDDGFDGYKRKKKEEERKKSDREVRREEITRARAAERDERLSERRDKEGKTMEFLREIARERFG